MIKCYQEIKHEVDLDKLRLIGFGADARKLYFQFSFIEKSTYDVTDIIDHYESLRNISKEKSPRVRVQAIPFECEPIIDHLLCECWEPAAEAMLLTLCVKQFGLERVESALSQQHSVWSKRQLRDEWDIRACRSGELAIMSPRYPHAQLDMASKKYVDAVMIFMGNDMTGARVLEVGSGTGRITERLVPLAQHLTSLDICERMISRNRSRLGVNAGKIKYLCQYAQDYKPKNRSYDVVVCSLVLIHNVEDSDFQGLVKMMCEAADKVFVFEDASGRIGTSPHTRLRSRDEIVMHFKEQRFQLDKESKYRLFGDQITFLKFVRA
jgi:SAM-dependent methyltransferase